MLFTQSVLLNTDIKIRVILGTQKCTIRQSRNKIINGSIVTHTEDFRLAVRNYTDYSAVLFAYIFLKFSNGSLTEVGLGLVNDNFPDDLAEGQSMQNVTIEISGYYKEV